MADVTGKTGLQIEDLDSAQILNNSTLFVISINGICKSLTFKNLVGNFAYSGDSENSEINFYNVKEIDDKFNEVEDKLDTFKNTIDASSNELKESISAMNKKFNELELTLKNSISETLSSYNNTINTTMNETIKKVDDKIKEITDMEVTLVHKSSVFDTIIAVGNWNGEEAPFTNRVAVTGATATNNVEVLLPGTVSLEQAEAWSNCGILHGTQEDGYITLIAYGEIPEIDIPVRFIIRDDV